MSEQRRVVAITSELPWPLDSGGHLRSFHILSAIARRFPTVLVSPVENHSHAHLAIEALRGAGIEVDAVPVGRRTPIREAARATGAALTRQPYVMYRRHFWSEVRDSVRRHRHGASILYMDHLDSVQYRQSANGLRLVGDMHNVYSLIASRAAERRSLIPRQYLRSEAALLARMEAQAAKRLDLVFATSDLEASTFQDLGATRVRVVPNGVDIRRYGDIPVARPSTPPEVLCLGTLSWAPNADAARFMAREVWPRIREVFPRHG